MYACQPAEIGKPVVPAEEQAKRKDTRISSRAKSQAQAPGMDEVG